MKVDYQCLPCLVRQATDSAKMVTEDIALQQEIISKALKEIAELGFTETAPYLGRKIHRIVKELSNNPDPYKELKVTYNEMAEKICEDYKLSDLVRTSENPVDAACRLSIAGNIIDFSVSRIVKESSIRESIKGCLEAEIYGNTSEELLQAAEGAKKILFIADNSGEIVFDKLLVNQLPKEKITYVVKGAPIVNDATMEDAVAVGMTEIVRVIDNGFDAQGTILEFCSEAFRKEFEEADRLSLRGRRIMKRSVK